MVELKIAPQDASEAKQQKQQQPAQNTNHQDGTTKQSNGTQLTTKNQSNEKEEMKKDAPVRLRRNLGLWNGVSIIVGIIIGSGIFVSPKGVLLESGSVGAALCVWCACGLLAMLGALCFAELGTSVAASGGEYTYISMAYGELLGFLYLWVLVVVIVPCSNAISALTFANYCLQPFYFGCEPPAFSIRLMSLAVLLLLVYVNCASVKGSLKLQTSFNSGKVLSLVLIIAFGLYYVATGRAASLAGEPDGSSIWSGTSTSWSMLAQAFYAGFFTYSGWSALNCVTEEIQNPARNMPRAIILSISGCTLIYILTNGAYFAVLTRQQILSSDAIAVIFGERVLPFAQWLMPLAVALTIMGGLNASIFASSRVYFVGSREGQLFRSLQMIHVDNLTPVPALLFSCCCSTLYLSSTSIQSLIKYMTFVESSFAALAVSTVLALRYQQPNLVRPFRVPTLVPIAYLLFSLMLLLLPLISAPTEAVTGLCIMLTGLPAYCFTKYWSSPAPAGAPKRKSNQRLTILIQKLTKSVAPTPETCEQLNL